MASQWSYVWRGTISIASTVALLNELVDDDVWAIDTRDAKAIQTWISGNAILWGPEIFGPAITRATGLGGVAAGASIAGGVALGVATTFAIIEVTAPTKKRKEYMREKAIDLFAPQFLGGKSFDELDYFGTLFEGGRILGENISSGIGNWYEETKQEMLHGKPDTIREAWDEFWSVRRFTL